LENLGKREKLKIDFSEISIFIFSEKNENPKIEDHKKLKIDFSRTYIL